MGGGLMQLVAMGAQDVYLTGNPQITFFKVVYRRHTNFSKECIAQQFTGSAAFGSSVSCTLARNGDLVQEIYLKITSHAVDAGDGVALTISSIDHTASPGAEITLGASTNLGANDAIYFTEDIVLTADGTVVIEKNKFTKWPISK